MSAMDYAPPPAATDPGAPSDQLPDQGRAAAIFASVVIHAAFIGLVAIVGWKAVDQVRRPPAPLMVADWTPPPLLPAVASAPPELPIPGGSGQASGPATRARVDSATAAAEAAQRMERVEPVQQGALAPRPQPVARSLGFERASIDVPRAAGFAFDRKRVAFLLDASGPMVGVQQAAQRELARKLAQLTPDQQYCIVLVRGDGCQTVPSTPAAASRESLERSLRWLAEHTEPRGRADLGAGLDCAFRALNPDGVCIIARGEAKSGARTTLVATAERLNPAHNGKRAAVFQCVELLEPTQGGALQQVGRTHGGPRGYQFLGRAELGLAAKAPVAPAPAPSSQRKP